MLSPEVIDALLADAGRQGLAVDGPGGLIQQMIGAVLERALEAEMAEHLGYDRGGAPVGGAGGNHRNGHGSKTVLTTAGPVQITVPRDRTGAFEPKIVPKRRRRLGQVDEAILSLYARGMTTRDIRDHLEEVYGAEVSHETVANVTDVVADEVRTWQHRPVDDVYPILHVDAIRIKVRDNGTVVNKAAHLVVGVDVDGFKQVLGVWIQETEGAKFWLRVLTDLRQRGLRDVLIVCCDGLTGLPDAIGAAWPDAVVQTCVVHLLRNSMRYVSYGDRKLIAKALRPIYTAVNADMAEAALTEFQRVHGRQYPGIVDAWQRAWNEFTPFLAFDADIRKIIYTTNMIESINYQLRKITKTRGHFPTDDAAIKLLYLGIRNISRQRGGEAGTGTWGWKKALNALAIHFPGRLPL
ncbi:IS256 family transposase [Dactylosporangium sp. NPDC049525]|uniref:IS256 family transposase n=1 Tax=Dactylosporangium sp. NPDC049525 TaxID=3154730 RepID=UPI003430899A